MPIHIICEPYTSDIIVGGYGRGRRRNRGPEYSGPNPDGSWERDDIRGFYQDLQGEGLVNANYESREKMMISLYQVRQSDLLLIERTLDLIPYGHLKWLKERKPEGIIFSNSAGRGRSERYTGGLNPGYDDRNTSFFDERDGIIITYGALWRYHYLGISPTLIHEIGHVMTHRGKISYRYFSDSNRERLSNTRVSRNPGSLEALCNAYMYFICYASATPVVRLFGSRPRILERSPETRAALRRCAAFSRRMLSPSEISNFSDR
ncbi:hypothetical protein SAMN04487910_0505 [Aquimarina amphilecti]|uniref:Uncharacterized protein n=1 Tax=Aquimarina amphilecti TaxID=1038014 RepID=A0A1H7GXR7_AQUAM|nr:hypothetical protein [Aquimarina amphilecti]SEK42881.1 hypothetical protein SAMN04487910_0505 [Aquimarina amphilecti]